MGEVIELEPGRTPLTLAHEMVERAPGCKAGIYILVREDDGLAYEMVGSQKAAVMWGLQKLLHILMHQ